MARAKSANSNDGMSWLALMPFPQFTPLNWWALATPRNAMLASLSTTKLALDAWRAGADGLRAMARLQQDEMLRMLEAPMQEAAERAEASAETADEQQAETTAALLVRPMVEATRAYGRVGRAFIVAQRDTLRAFAPPEQPH
ncbi:MAG: hypothetical protein AB7H66_02875 [Hyphomonadaceae bacterium]